jgi:hypothetical protein
MALWFAELGARDVVFQEDTVFHVTNSYQSARDKEKNVTVDLDYIQQSALQAGGGGWWGA